MIWIKNEKKSWKETVNGYLSTFLGISDKNKIYTSEKDVLRRNTYGTKIHLLVIRNSLKTNSVLHWLKNNTSNKLFSRVKLLSLENLELDLLLVWLKYCTLNKQFRLKTLTHWEINCYKYSLILCTQHLLDKLRLNLN